MEVFAKLRSAKTSKSLQNEASVPPSKEEIINVMESYAPEKPQEKQAENNNNSDQLSRGSSFDTRADGMDSPVLSASLSHSYSTEWEKLFMTKDVMNKLKDKAMEGDLRSSRFRSLIWKVRLIGLESTQCRFFIKAKKCLFLNYVFSQLIVNPRKAVDSVDITLNNPLSQDEESPWNKFFQDNELRLTIKQDVIRTFPEVEFFRGTKMGDMMIDILFCYSRECATNSYKQGMHELLAPLIFVLHCDHQAFLHACEIESVLDIIKEVMDPTYLEHDAYTMFCQVMETVEPWYLSRDMFFNPKTGSMRNLEMINATPFSRSQDLNPSNAIVTKLTRIQDYILKKFDPELHLHLERLEIAPQIYGIRWLRLLFGREFPMQDLLMLWDAIFGDGIGFDLVDYIFVAMLLYIKDVLLTSDYATCLTALMKYPPVSDVHYFVVKARWLREPNQQPRPPSYTHQGAYKGSSVAGSSESIGNVSTIAKDSSTKTANNPIGSTVSLSQVEESMFRHNPAASLARMEASNLRSAQSSPGVHHSSMFPLTPDDTSLASSPTKSKGKQKKMSKLEKDLQEQVMRLQGEQNDINSMCRYCASKLDVHIGRLQQELSRQNFEIDDDIMVSLAGLKLVRDILNGTLKFSQNIAADDEEIQINDDFYGNQNGDGFNSGTGVTSPDSDILLGATSAVDEFSKMSSVQRGRLFYMSSDEVSSPESGPTTATNIAGKIKGLTTAELNHEDNLASGENLYSRDKKNNNPVQFSSKIRGLFKSDSSSPKQTQASSTVAGSKPGTASNVEHQLQQTFKSPPNQQQRRASHSEKEMISFDSRRRAKSNMETQSQYWPDFANAGSEHGSPKGHYFDVPDSHRRNDDRRREEHLGRERSKSQPTTSINLYRGAYNGEDEDYAVNPLYKLHYHQNMEH
ncbi:unnamed protein product [Lymnaea stagnalis]|uniref:Rab-GAP TBC domain-containing protein n=1 Tax=Lymnaea stagnalis TaxID=6523 RepID=A0AAV2HW82_LYMST